MKSARSCGFFSTGKTILVPRIYCMGINKICVKEDIIQGMYCIRKIYANYGRQPLFNRTANDDTSLLKIKKIE
jgi:hypothetical protein